MGKVGVLLNVECEEEKGRRGRRPVRKYYTKKEATNVICTPKVRHFWRCIFLWQRKDKNIENTRQNSNYLL